MNTKKLFDLSDKVIIITGAAGNLGSQYAEGLSEVGANVVLGDLDYTKCKQLSTKLKKKYDVDLKLVRTIISKINTRPIHMSDILQLFKNEPNLKKINQNHKPNEGYMKSLKNDDEFTRNLN